MLTFEQARSKVIEQVKKMRGSRETTSVDVWDALGMVLAQEVKTDREYPPFNRSTRDGFAVRSKEVAPGTQLKCIGEIKAGDTITEALAAGTCVQIMTGAAVPAGADAVVMIEHTQRDGDLVRFERGAKAGQNIVPRGSEAQARQVILLPGMRLGFAELALAAQVGVVQLQCLKRPHVAILSTGDEVVPIEQQPGEFQIRNSNSVSLAAQVRIAGGEPVVLGNAADRAEDLAKKSSLACGKISWSCPAVSRWGSTISSKVLSRLSGPSFSLTRWRFGRENRRFSRFAVANQCSDCRVIPFRRWLLLNCSLRRRSICSAVPRRAPWRW